MTNEEAIWKLAQQQGIVAKAHLDDVIPAYEVAIEAIKKQIRMKPIRETDRESLINILRLIYEDQTNQVDEDYFEALLQNVEDSPDNSEVTYWCCPFCHQILTGYHPHYCSDCGQALDWSEM